jgi:hypothetical protein
MGPARPRLPAMVFVACVACWGGGAGSPDPAVHAAAGAPPHPFVSRHDVARLYVCSNGYAVVIVQPCGLACPASCLQVCVRWCGGDAPPPSKGGCCWKGRFAPRAPCKIISLCQFCQDVPARAAWCSGLVGGAGALSTGAPTKTILAGRWAMASHVLGPSFSSCPPAHGRGPRASTYNECGIASSVAAPWRSAR